MANKRKPISKKIRFEVFKRDKFTCQYCGRSAPDVVLEVDHIKPVSKGGENDLLNYVTSCYECNRGKGARELSDDSLVKKQQRQLQELAERKEQLEMMIDWRKELQNIKEDFVDKINDYIAECSGWKANDVGKKKIKKWIRDFSYEQIVEAIDISFEQYFQDTEESWNHAFNKIGGICANREYDKKNGHKRYYFNYILKVCKEKFSYWSEYVIGIYVDNYINDDDDFDKVKKFLKYANNWSQFKENMEREFYE